MNMSLGSCVTCMVACKIWCLYRIVDDTCGLVPVKDTLLELQGAGFPERLV